MTALVVQCFIKRDTLAALHESLLRVVGRETLDVIFWVDHPRGSRKEAEYAALQAGVIEDLKKLAQIHCGDFRSIEIYQNNSNRGTCGTCRAALDFAFGKHEFVIFVEDDVVFSRDALVWFQRLWAMGLLEQEAYWAIAGESIFFNAGSHQIDDAFIAREHAIAARENLVGFYTAHNFMPSTVFATTRRRWAEFGATRGQPTGDVDVNLRCKTEGKHTIFPIVPRVKDIGMLHDLGYSVLIHSKAGVSEVKQTYLLAEDLLPAGDLAKSEMREFDGDAGALFSRTSLLKD